MACVIQLKKKQLGGISGLVIFRIKMISLILFMLNIYLMTYQ